MLIRSMKSVALEKAIYEKKSNGIKNISSYEEIDTYKVCFLQIEDMLSASVYGSGINSIKRISSLRNELEIYLMPKMDSVEDNISKYVISYENKKYKIKAVKPHYIDIECL